MRQQCFMFYWNFFSIDLNKMCSMQERSPNECVRPIILKKHFSCVKSLNNKWTANLIIIKKKETTILTATSLFLSRGHSECFDLKRWASIILQKVNMWITHTSVFINISVLSLSKDITTMAVTSMIYMEEGHSLVKCQLLIQVSVKYTSTIILFGQLPYLIWHFDNEQLTYFMIGWM